MINRISGENLDWPNEDQRAEARIARMRVRVWWGVKALVAIRGLLGGSLTMYTLTYAKCGEWEPGHISAFCRWLRDHGTVGYTWVAELQERGAVHYHILSVLPQNQRWVKPTIAAGGWAKGFTWVTPHVRKPFYIMKYIQKGVSREKRRSWPKGIRLYGVARRALSHLSYNDRCDERLSLLPVWFREGATSDSRSLSSKRAVGGVVWGESFGISPFSKVALADVAGVAQVMYTRWWGGASPPSVYHL